MHTDGVHLKDRFASTSHSRINQEKNLNIILLICGMDLLKLLLQFYQITGPHFWKIFF